jgi:hypothetical protein
MSNDANAIVPRSVVSTSGATAPAVDGSAANALSGEDTRNGPDALRRQFATLSPEQRAAAARQAETLGAIGQSLASRPYGERRTILAHMAPQLIARGMPSDAIGGFDPTDANLASIVDQAGALGRMLTPQPGAETVPPKD